MRLSTAVHGALLRVASVLLAGLFLSQGPVSAFGSKIHPELTRSAFVVLMDPGTVSSLGDTSLIGDTKAWTNSAAHYDNCAWNEGRQWIVDHRANAVTAAHAYFQSSGPQQAVFDELGYILHATEDFYAHSNWVENHDWGVLADFDGPKPQGWISGFFKDDYPQLCPSGSPTHTDLNKDEPDRPYYDEARADAILAIQDQISKFKTALAAKYPSEAGAILLKLGIKAQPSVVDDAFAWPNGKVYFFAGAKYFYYDMAADHVVQGYPFSIVDFWAGLDPFANGIDAGFAADSTKAYFFRGDRYIRYDIAADQAVAGYPRAIAPNWKGLWTCGIDAVVLWPNGKVYAFKGPQYIYYDLAADQVAGGYPRAIARNWHGLEPFSGGIDAVFIAPTNGKAYFFKGGYYIRYDVALDRADPGYLLPIKDYWHGL